jgi:hypothetical protein
VVEFGRSINIVSPDVMPAVSALVWYLDLLQGFPITLDILERLELIKANKIVFLFDCSEEIGPLKCFCLFAYENNLGNLVLSSILFQTSSQKSTVEPSPTVQEAIARNWSISLSTSRHQKDPLLFVA